MYLHPVFGQLHLVKNLKVFLNMFLVLGGLLFLTEHMNWLAAALTFITYLGVVSLDSILQTTYEHTVVSSYPKGDE